MKGDGGGSRYDCTAEMDVATAFLAYRNAGWPVSIDKGHIDLALGEGWCVVVVEGEGRKALEKLAAANTTAGTMPRTLEVASVQGAWIYLFRHKGSMRTALNLHGVTPGVHVWGAGRSVRLPPSESDDAFGQVRWAGRAGSPTTLAVERVPELPTWLDEAARDPNAGRRAWDRVLTPSSDATPCTDLGNAERLVRRHGRDLRWCGAWGTWLVWDGARWAKDETGEVVRRAKDTVRAIVDEAQKVTHEETRRKLLAHALSSEKASRIMSMIDLGRSEVGVSISPEQLDTHPWLLNCTNGTVDLQTGQLGPHRREDLLTKVCSVPFVRDERSEEFERFLARVQPDEEIRSYLQRFAGYCASGVIREHVFPVWWGTGRNGKGTLTDAIRSALGPYATEIPTELLVARKHDAHPTERTTLFGARFATASETEQEVRLAVALVKRLTGGDVIKARYMKKDFFEFEPTHKIVLATNNKPIINETSNAIWDRVHLVPWSVRIPDSERDGALRDRLKNEARTAVLAWIVAGCLAWQRDGLRPPEAVRAATREYETESDDLAGFLVARTTTTPDPLFPKVTVKVLAGAIYKEYVRWCEGAGVDPISNTAFGRKLRVRKGVTKIDNNSAGYPEYVGLRILTAPELRKIAEAERLPAAEGSTDSSDRSEGESVYPPPISPSWNDSRDNPQNYQDCQ